ncbi:flagellar basal body P-ring formation chaperone FlgA [Burkholderia sp. BCC0044]|uniref:flagellar basal body P-ring formation chaperone FlgA n=1 Tax=Burkholderia sp. BCC0044 TaxID=2676295 RepID=UPI00158EE50E|nr:flagellar basal body P-ring formation chaperone FlgA [Burkholderia sp. BCC0044]
MPATGFPTRLIEHVMLAAVASGFAMPLAASAQVSAPATASASDPAVAQVEKAARAWLAQYVAEHALSEPRASATVTAPRRPAPACDAPYDIVATDTRVLTRMRFSVRCPSESRATVYTVKAHIDAPVLVATAALAPNQPLSEANFTRDVRDVALTPDALTDPAQAVGRTLRRAVRAGQVIQMRLLKGVEVIRRGQTVQIVADGSGVQVSVPGTAMQSGAIDDVIRVKNASSGKIVTARVTSAGTVEPIGASK